MYNVKQWYSLVCVFLCRDVDQRQPIREEADVPDAGDKYPEVKKETHQNCYFLCYMSIIYIYRKHPFHVTTQKFPLSCAFIKKRELSILIRSHLIII